MFDTLLDEFEAVAAQSTEAMTSGFRKLPVDDNEDNNVAVAIAEQAKAKSNLTALTNCWLSMKVNHGLMTRSECISLRWVKSLS